MFSHFLRGDFRYFYSENISNFITIPQAWDSSLNTGIGVSQLGSLWITSYLNFTSFFHKIGFRWDLISLLFWMLPAIILSFVSPILLFRYIFPNIQKQFAVLSGLVHVGNTYFLMVLTGGQLGVSLAYSLAPLVLLGFIRLIDRPNLKIALISGIFLSFQTLFDPRIVYLTLIALLIYSLFNFDKIRKIRDKIYLPIPFVVCVLLNSFWILPLVLTGNSPIPQGFGSALGFEFFSFADFSHSMSLLHPNFPENIFGKTYFLRPEFLILPAVAFCALLFDRSRKILFFSTLALIGIFLAKGINEPFGFINKFIFEFLPGMQMFRDPTKFYLLIALSYSVLIPFSLFQVSKQIQDRFSISNFKFPRPRQAKRGRQISNLFLLFTILYLFFLIRPLWLGEQREIFKSREIPKEYVQLKDFLHNQDEFFRTLWIPQWQRFGFFSNNHPAIGREVIFKGDYGSQIEELNNPSSQYLLQDLSVKYIIVPYDSEEEVFLTDRKYDEEKFADAIKRIEEIDWLKKIDEFEKPAVFEIIGYKDHFWSPSTTLRISYEYANATEHKIQVQNARSGDRLVFSEGFDKNWSAQKSPARNATQSVAGGKFKVKSSRFEGGLNSFVLPEEGSYDLKIYYEPQKWVNLGLLISGTTLLFILGTLILKKKEEQ